MPTAEPWVVLGALAVRTGRIRLGHRRPLGRAARRDGVLLASLGEDGSILKISPGEAEDVAGELAARREAAGSPTDDRPFDISVSGPELPDDAELAVLARLGVTWFHVTGWIDEIGGLADLARSGPR